MCICIYIYMYILELVERFFESRLLIFLNNFLHFRSNTIEKQAIINLCSCTSTSNNHWTTGKNPRGNTTDRRFLLGIDNIRNGKMQQILHTNDISKETHTAKMMHCKNTKAMICSSDGDNDLVDIVTVFF